MTVSDTARLVRFCKTSLRAIIPKSLLKEREIILRLGSGAGRDYARMRLLNTIGFNRMNTRLVPANARSFVFVCFGNIMRSPMADAMLKQAAITAKFEVRSDSAGLHAVPGNQAHPWAQTAASEMGISMGTHRAKLLTTEMVEQADAVFAMDLQNMAELLNLYPRFEDKLFMLAAYTGQHHPLKEIPDPYFGDLEATRQCYRLLRDCVQNLVASRIAHVE
jgi:protein-tyrosine phosphatase